MSFTATREPFFVLDKNQLRAPHAVGVKADADAAGLGVLVIDTTFKEMARAGPWPEHYSDDMGAWTDRPQRMSLSRGVAEILSEERETGARASVVDSELSNWNHGHLAQLAAGNTSALAARAAVFQQELKKMEGPGGALNAGEKVTMMRSLVTALWDHGSNALRENLRKEIEDGTSGPLVRLGQQVMNDLILRGALLYGLQCNGYPEATARSLLDAPTFTNFLHSSYVAYATLLWAQGNRLAGSVNPERFLNQSLDLDYIGYGLCCESLATGEAVIRRLEAGLRKACTERWS